MTQIKYTKTELRAQQFKLTQLEKYLPTLQLKKALLQMEITQAEQEVQQTEQKLKHATEHAESFAPLLTAPSADKVFAASTISSINKRFENIAGIEIPIYDGIEFAAAPYSLFDTPVWFESAVSGIQELVTYREQIVIFKEKKHLLEKELREVSIRVNLFEKIMIPRTKKNIKKIKIFLGDQQLAAVSQAKVSKRKILERKGLA